jgi:phospholipid/cholesterol/gamma-HCH transport system ATP-binding protein
MADEPFIEVSDLVVKYGERTVLNGLSFTVARGEVFVILGGSGCGKSTLLRTLVGLQRPSAGRIRIKGRDFTGMSDEEQLQIRQKMGMCFQGSALWGSMTVGDNVALPLREHTKLEESTIEIITKIKLDLVGLGGFEDYLPSQLSGGMKKRAGLARAMAMDPDVIFYDEPSAGLDPIVAAGLDALIRKMQRTFNLTSIVVTHEMASVDVIADRVLMLQAGNVVAFGTPGEVKAAAHPYVRQFFERQPDEKSAGTSHYFSGLREGAHNAGQEA